MEWLYTVTDSVPEGNEVEVRVKAYDLSGNVMEGMQGM